MDGLNEDISQALPARADHRPTVDATSATIRLPDSNPCSLVTRIMSSVRGQLTEFSSVSDLVRLTPGIRPKGSAFLKLALLLTHCDRLQLIGRLV